MEIKLETGHGTLTQQEERKLISRAQKGDTTARNRIIDHNIELVISRTGRFYQLGAFLEREDLIQCGCLGLMRAIEKFDLSRCSNGTSRKVTFGTYAVPWIEHEMRRANEQYGRTVAVPSHIQRMYHLQQRVEMHNASPKEPCVRTISKPNLERMNVMRHSMVTLDAPLAVGSATLYDGLFEKESDPIRHCDRAEMPHRLRTLLSLLPKRERFILQESLGLESGDEGRPLGEIGKHLGITPERTRQLKVNALRKLREDPVVRAYAGHVPAPDLDKKSLKGMFPWTRI